MTALNDDIIQLRSDGSVVVATLQRGGFRDEIGVLDALERLGGAMESRKCVRMVLDMAVVEYLSSAGLGRLVGLLKRARKSGGDLILAAVQSEIFELLELMRLTRIFQVVDTVEEAVAAHDAS